MFNKIISTGLIVSFNLILSCNFISREETQNSNDFHDVLGEKSKEALSINVLDTPHHEYPITRAPLPTPKFAGPPPSLNANFWSNYSLPVPPLPPIALPSPHSDDDADCSCDNNCETGTAVFSGGPDDWFEIETLVYPATVLLSQNRNNGEVQGHVRLTPTGLQIGRSGTYWASFTAILSNEYPDYAPLIPVFLVPNGVFNPENPNAQISAVTVVPPQYITTAQASGILMHLEAGTTLSLLATNGGSPQPEEVEVISWTITINRICD